MSLPPRINAEQYSHNSGPSRPRSFAGGDHIIIIFTLWLVTLLALLKSFLEHLMRPGIAFEHQQRGFPKKLLKSKSARLIVTMGMPALFYRWLYFNHGLRALKRNILAFVGIRPVGWNK